MIRMSPIALAGFAAALFAAPVVAPAAAQEIGSVALVQVYGYETPPASAREPIFVRDAVVADTELETVSDGRLDVRFIDDTRLIVGPGSSVKVDRFVFDPNRTAGQASLNVGKGVMRFVTGRLASDSYSISTPTATMGVRGTDFVVAVDAAGATAVSVLSGGVQVTSASGATAAVNAGFTGETDGGDVSVSPTAGAPALSTLSFGVADQGGEQSDGDAGGGGSGDH